MKLKDPTGWFAAGPRMLQALFGLSDGAFKLFAYLSLTAGRTTGTLRVTQLELARVLAKSRNSISAYLEELTTKGLCLIKPSPNQHQPGEIEIADAFWPYHKEVGNKPSVSDSDLLAARHGGVAFGSSNSPASTIPRPATEALFIERVRDCLLQYSIFSSSFGTTDRTLAAQLFGDGLSFEQLERAFLIGLTRKYCSSLDSTSTSSIYSLAYFVPILDELPEMIVSDQYWDYLRLRLKVLDHAWRDRRRPPKVTRPVENPQACDRDRPITDPYASIGSELLLSSG
jgi:hypothetical protein